MFDVTVATYYLTDIQKEFYRSLVENTDIDFRLLIVYTGKDDKEAEWLEEGADIFWYPRNNLRPLIQVCNWAARQSEENDLIFMSDDIYLPKDWGKAFTWAMKKCKMVSASQTFLSEKDFTLNKKIDGINQRNLKLITPGAPPGFVACCYALSRDAYNEIGEFDENYQLWCGDTDYWLRAREAGISPKKIQGFNIYHYRWFSLNRIPDSNALKAKDRAYFEKKYPNKPRNL